MNTQATVCVARPDSFRGRYGRALGRPAGRGPGPGPRFFLSAGRPRHSSDLAVTARTSVLDHSRGNLVQAGLTLHHTSSTAYRKRLEEFVAAVGEGANGGAGGPVSHGTAQNSDAWYYGRNRSGPIRSIHCFFRLRPRAHSIVATEDEICERGHDETSDIHSRQRARRAADGMSPTRRRRMAVIS